MQRQHQRIHLRERRLRPADLAHARQEGEHIARRLGQHGADGAGHGFRQVARAGEVARLMADLHRVHAAGALDHRRVHQGRKPRAIEGRGHRQQPQVGPQQGLRIQAEGERQIGLQRALMDFVEDHGRDAIQPRIGEQPADEQPRRHHLDPRRGRDGAVDAGAEAHGLAHRLADQARHAGGGGAGGEPPGLQHHDAAGRPGGFAQQRKRHRRRLAGAGRGHQHGVGTRLQRREKPRQRFRDRQALPGYQPPERRDPSSL